MCDCPLPSTATPREHFVARACQKPERQFPQTPNFSFLRFTLGLRFLHFDTLSTSGLAVCSASSLLASRWRLALVYSDKHRALLTDAASAAHDLPAVRVVRRRRVALDRVERLRAGHPLFEYADVVVLAVPRPVEADEVAWHDVVDVDRVQPVLARARVAHDVRYVCVARALRERRRLTDVILLETPGDEHRTPRTHHPVPARVLDLIRVGR